MADERLDDPRAYRGQPRRRYGLALALAIALLAAGYWLSPYIAVARFALAANAGATEAVVQRIDFAQLRSSFARQIVRAYIARNPPARDLDPLSRQALSSVASGYVSAIIADYLTPEAIADLLAGRQTASRAAELPAGAALPRIDGLGEAWQLFLASGFTGPMSFAVAVPVDADLGSRYGLQFGLSGTSWLLRAIALPEAALNRLADELKARIARGA